MGLVFYTLAQLRNAGKAVVRGLLTNAGTEDGTDFALWPRVAAQMLQGTQVAAQHIYEQVFPSTATAETRESMLERHGLDFTKEATKARGYLMVGNTGLNMYNAQVAKGTTFEFPASAFADGKARTYVALEDAVFRPETDVWATETAGVGNSQTKIRGRTAALKRGDYVLATDGGRTGRGIVRYVDDASRTFDLFHPIAVDIDDGDTLIQEVKYLLIKAEAQEAGVDGNAASGATAEIESSDETFTHGFVVEMGGGGDAVGEIDGDTARVIRVLEDTIACPPSNGNVQHWREIALACPDVDLDDAIVYTGVRGPGTIDIVCIGRKGQLRASGFPDTNVAHLPHGHNTRRIGEVQAAIVESWCRSKQNYYDDVRCRSVEWDRRGCFESHYSTPSFFRTSLALGVAITPMPGYGADSGVSFGHVPSVTNDMTRVYADSGSRVSSRLKVGDRVTVTLKSSVSNYYPVTSVTTQVIGIDYDRRFAIIPDLTPIAMMMWPVVADARISYWTYAGPLNQLVETAIYDYFDSLGPGHYTSPALNPGYQVDKGVTVPRFAATSSIERWPDPGRRWHGGFRKSALLAKLHAIEGVKSVTVARSDGTALVDFDPAPLQTLAFAGAHIATTG
jgi:hypothetical protein